MGVAAMAYLGDLSSCGLFNPAIAIGLMSEGARGLPPPCPGAVSGDGGAAVRWFLAGLSAQGEPFRFNVDGNQLTLAVAAPQNRLGDGCLQFSLNRTLQRPCSVDRV